MIRRIYVDNYKSLVNFELRLEELTLLVGSNGAGKSAVLDVVLALRELLSGSAKVHDVGIFPTSSRTRWQNVAVQVFELDVVLGAEVFQYRLEVEHDAALHKARVGHERLRVAGKPLFMFADGDVHLYRDDHTELAVFSVNRFESALARVVPGRDSQRVSAFLEFMRKLVVCGLYPRAFSAESSLEEPGLARDGSNFASWYRNMLLERQELMPGYTAAIAEVIEGLHGIRMERVGTDARALVIVFDDGRGRYELRLDELSDGQRALLALYALAYLTAGQGSAIFLDEPDNYVALVELQPWLVRLSDACGEAIPQVVLCSHHPELIDYLGGERGVALAREASGVTTVKRLSELELGATMKLSEVIARGWD
jgi:predicted ATPase